MVVVVVGRIGAGVVAPVIHLVDDVSMEGGDPGLEVDLHPYLLKSHPDMLKVEAAEAVVEEETHHSGLTRRLEMMKSHRSSSMPPN